MHAYEICKLIRFPYFLYVILGNEKVDAIRSLTCSDSETRRNSKLDLEVDLVNQGVLCRTASRYVRVFAATLESRPKYGMEEAAEILSDFARGDGLEETRSDPTKEPLMRELARHRSLFVQLRKHQSPTIAVHMEWILEELDAWKSLGES